MHDIYEDTCLHPAVIADGIAPKFAPNDPNKLATTLETLAVARYRYNAAFRQKLQGANLDNNQEAPAVEAREWLWKEMTDWAREIVGTP